MTLVIYDEYANAPVAPTYDILIDFDTVPRNNDKQGRSWAPVPGKLDPIYVQSSLDADGYSMRADATHGGLAIYGDDLKPLARDFDLEITWFIDQAVSERILFMNRGNASGGQGGNADGQFMVTIFNNGFVFYLGSTSFVTGGSVLAGWNKMRMQRRAMQISVTINGALLGVFGSNNMPFGRWTLGDLDSNNAGLYLEGYIDRFLLDLR